MGRSVNKVTLIGTLGRDPEVRYMPNGNAVANLTMATDESYNDKQTGQKVEQTEWHRLVVYGKLAEIVQQYLKKGSKAYFEGRLKTREWEKDGVKRYTTEIVCNDMMMLDNRNNGGGDMSGGMNNGMGGGMNSGYPQQGAAGMMNPTAAPSPAQGGMGGQGYGQPQQPAQQAPMHNPQGSYQQPYQQPAPAPQQPMHQQPQQAPQQVPQQVPQQPTSRPQQPPGGYQQAPAPQAAPQPGNSFDDFDDDIPF